MTAIGNLLRAGGLDVERRTCMKLDPFRRDFSLVRNMRVNYTLLAHRAR